MPGALESISAFSDDVLVLDSFSTDRTVEIARAAGARLEQRPFDNYAAQRMAGLNLVFKNPWTLILDADERVSPELGREMSSAIQSVKSDVCMFRMRRKDMFLGRWLRHSSGYPTWFGRLVRPGMVRIERDINEEYIPLGKVGYLVEHLVHFPFNRGVTHWLDRHNSYSTLEASRIHLDAKSPIAMSRLLSRDPVGRRKEAKKILYRLPLRPSIVFFYLYFVRLGFLDGFPGFLFCRLRALYEFQIDVKARELELAGSGRRHDAGA